jgi:hypothetical protein
LSSKLTTVVYFVLPRHALVHRHTARTRARAGSTGCPSIALDEGFVGSRFVAPEAGGPTYSFAHCVDRNIADQENPIEFRIGVEGSAIGAFCRTLIDVSDALRTEE